MAANTVQWLKDLKDDFEKDMVRALKVLGKKAMNHAYLTGHTDAPRAGSGESRASSLKWRHKLGNLHDSFGCAVYVNGVLVQSSVQYIGGTISKKRDPRTGKNGRQTVKDYLHRIHFGAKNEEIVLVVVAAMFYTKWLEDANTGLGKYVVISPAKKFINENYASYVEPVYRKHGFKQKPKMRVVEGERLRGLSNFVKDE